MKVIIGFLDYCYAAILKVASFFVRQNPTRLNPDLRTVIVVPGVYETSLYFRNLSKTLQDNYNVVHAQAIYGHKKNMGIQSTAKHISEYIDCKKLTEVVLVGHSSGGLVAVKTLTLNDSRIAKVITIAAPFHGVLNGHLLRTKIVRELLPSSTLIKSFSTLPESILSKVTSIYPSFDNQVWSKRGSYLEGAQNMRLNTKGHHLILRSDELSRTIAKALSQATSQQAERY